MNGGEPDTVRPGAPARRSAGSIMITSVPRVPTLVLAGDFRSDPIALAERCFGGWRNDAQRRLSPAGAGCRRPAHGPDRPARRRPGRRTARWLRHRPARSALVRVSVASYAMGGAFLSRLNAVLREEKGYTYGVRMNFGPLRTGGCFAVQGSFRTEVVVDALASLAS